MKKQSEKSRLRIVEMLLDSRKNSLENISNLQSQIQKLQSQIQDIDSMISCIYDDFYRKDTN